MSEERKLKRRKRRDRRRERRKSRPNAPAYQILRLLAYALLKPLFNVKTVNLEMINRQRGPLLLLGNHSSVIDPFIVAIFIRRPVQYVISDSQIRSRFLSFVLGLVGVIPKTKVVADLDTVKRIVAVKRENGIIGIFPEGQSSWDGHSLPIVRATDKLVKSLKIPVFTAQIRGAYFTWPRWARSFRRGEIRIFFDRVFNEQELKTLSVDEVGQRVRSALEFDAFDYQDRARITYQGARQAEYLERALFLCPSCNALGTMYSRHRRISCTSCGYSVYLAPSGRFEPRSGPLRFDTIRAWNLWQLKEYHRLLDQEIDRRTKDSPPFLIEPAVRVQQGYKALPLETIGEGLLEFTVDHIRFTPEGEEPWVFPVMDIEGINVQNNEHLEFYVYNSLYRVSTVDPRGNTYKWDAAVRRVQSRLQQAAVST